MLLKTGSPKVIKKEVSNKKGSIQNERNEEYRQSDRSYVKRAG